MITCAHPSPPNTIRSAPQLIRGWNLDDRATRGRSSRDCSKTSRRSGAASGRRVPSRCAWRSAGKAPLAPFGRLRRPCVAIPVREVGDAVRGGDGRSERCSRMCGSGRWMIRRAASSEQLMGKNIAVDPLTPVELRVGIADSGRGAAPGTERRRVRHRLVQRSRRARQCTSSAAGRWKLACGYPRDADRLPRRVPTVLDDRPLVRRAAPIPLQRQLDA